MLETIKVICIMLYSQVTMLIPGFIRNEETHIDTYSICKYSAFNFSFLIFQMILYYYLPGKKVFGTKTKLGNIPSYNDNGFLAFLITMFLQYKIMNNYFSIEELTTFIDNLGGYQFSLNIFGFYISLLIYMRTKINPELNEPIKSGNFILDFYKGVELHPQSSFGDIKLVINSRFGMMLWACIVFLTMFVSDSHNVLISGSIQLMYIVKFFLWESGYVKTSDITLDRCGYYLFWGCICYVPTFYTVPIIYHYYNPVEPNFYISLYTLVFGYLFIYTNWKIDTHRTEMREYARKNEKVVEKFPKNFIKATYKTSDGEENRTWLISSDFYSLCRHPSYLFEILSTVTWTMPGYIPNKLVSYLYLMFLIVLLVHRTYRIDKKCLEKYKESWIHYQIMVPYKIIPGIF